MECADIRKQNGAFQIELEEIGMQLKDLWEFMQVDVEADAFKDKIKADATGLADSIDELKEIKMKNLLKIF